MKDTSDAGAVFLRLARALREQAERHGFLDQAIPIQCRPLTPVEAIGDPGDRDYPILKGKEALVEARFREARGQAFSDTYGNRTVTVRALLDRVPKNNRERAEFTAALNAVYRSLGLCDGTVHCKDDEPKTCAMELEGRIPPGKRVLLVGLQPRMLQFLAGRNPVRVADLDPDNRGTVKYGVRVEGPEETKDGIAWCERILATGSTLVNGTLPLFLASGKPVIFYGVTVAAAAKVLGLERFCACAH